MVHVRVWVHTDNASTKSSNPEDPNKDTCAMITAGAKNGDDHWNI